MSLNPYLFFNGQCEEAFKFYERVFGGKLEAIHRYAGSPMANQLPPEWGNKVMHATLNLGGGMILMGSDAAPGRYNQAPQGFFVSMGVKEVAETERIFNELAENGRVEMPVQQTFWSQRFGMLVDQFGIPWMLNCEQAAALSA